MPRQETALERNTASFVWWRSEQDAALPLTHIFDIMVYVIAEARQCDSAPVSQYSRKGVYRLCVHVSIALSDVVGLNAH